MTPLILHLVATLPLSIPNRCLATVHWAYLLDADARGNVNFHWMRWFSAQYQPSGYRGHLLIAYTTALPVKSKMAARHRLLGCSNNLCKIIFLIQAFLL